MTTQPSPKQQEEARKIVARWKREIKKVLSHFIISHNPDGPCWCRSWSEGEHSEGCVAARKLYEKIK